MLLLEPAAGLACYASREGSVELFEDARCHLGSRAAIVSARQRLLPALWLCVGCGFASRVPGSVPLLLHVSHALVVACLFELASCKTLATLGAASDEQQETLRIEALLFLKGNVTVVTPLRRANESEQCCGTPEAVSTGEACRAV